MKNRRFAISPLLALIFLALSIGSNIRAQSNADSLRNIWNDITQDDTTRLSAVNILSFDTYSRSRPDSALFYAIEQVEFAEKKGKSEWVIKGILNQAQALSYLGDLNQALELNKKALKIASEVGNAFQVHVSYYNMSTVYWQLGEIDSALEAANIALEYFESQDLPSNLTKVLATLGQLYSEKGDYEQAVPFLSRSVQIANRIGDRIQEITSLNSLGAIYTKQEQYEAAGELFMESKVIAVEIGSVMHQAMANTNLGSVYQAQGDFDKAIQSFSEALAVVEQLGIKRAISGISSNIGGVYYEKGDFEKAGEFYEKSLTIAKEIGAKLDMAGVYHGVANVYLAKKEYSKAIFNAEIGLELAREIGSPDLIKVNAWILTESFEAIGKDKEALEMYKLKIEMSDSLDKIENQEASIRQQYEFNYEKKILADSLKTSEDNLIIQHEHENVILKKEKERNILIGSGLLLLLIAGGLWGRNRFVKKNNARLKIARHRAEESEAFKQQFLANMSHEIRTPMHAISGMVKILERNEHPPAQNEFLRAMHISSDNLVVILNDVLDLSKIEAGKLDLESIPMNPASVIENVSQILKFKAEEKGLLLNYLIDETVPELVMGDPTRLNQILINLVGNAIKFTEKGSIEIELIKIKETLRFSVIDTGIGISKTNVVSIFEAFEQAKDSTSRNYGGTGLGLSISKQLTELQNGKIWVESEAGKGSTFYIELPIVNAAADAISADLITDEDLKAMAKSLKGIRILLAEDNAFNQMIAQDDLGYYIEGVTIDTVENGALAFEKFQTDQYDLILMDVQMPEMNGFEVTEKIRAFEKLNERTNAIPIIAMTASLLKTEINSCYYSGMDNYIPKPYKVEELIGTIYTELRS